MLDLRIDFDALADVSQKVATNGEEFQTLLNTIKSQNAQLSEAWAGSDAEAYSTAVARQADVMQKLSEAITGIGNFLNDVNVAYQKAQEDNRSAINLND